MFRVIHISDSHNFAFPGYCLQAGAMCKTAFHVLNLSDHFPLVPGGVIPPFQ